MSDNGPTISVTRGAKKRETVPNDTSTDEEARSSTERGLPDPRAVVSGAVRGAWLAGLGVLSLAGEAGSAAFESLVEKGKSWERAQAEQAEARGPRPTGRADRGGETSRALEVRVRRGVDGVLRRLGVPLRHDLDELNDEIDTLAQNVERLSRAVEDEDS